VAELFLVRPQNPLAFHHELTNWQSSHSVSGIAHSVVGDGPFGFIAGIIRSYIACISIRRDPSIVGAGSD